MERSVSPVILRPWLESDAACLAALGNNVLIFNNMTDGFPSPYTEEKALAFIRTARSNTTNIVRAIEYEHETIGIIGFFPQTDIYRTNGRIAYFLGQEYWGKGLMPCAIVAMCRLVFGDRAEIMRIFAEPFGSNVASWRVLEKAGFTREGVLRRNVVKNGDKLDSYVYSILREEFERFDAER